MNILIENAVPLNNGDAALIFALGEKLESLGHSVMYSCSEYKVVKKMYPEKKWIPSILSYRWVNNMPVFKQIYYYLSVLFRKKLKNQDLIISAPGGYINSYYGFENKMLILNLYKKLLNKPIIMFSQSVGPLSKNDEKLLVKYLPIFSEFFVRDSISYNRVRSVSTYSNLFQTYDAALMLGMTDYHNKKVTNRIAISVRKWQFDKRDEVTYHNLVKKVIKICIEKGYSVTFLSTCQGIPRYVDDTISAKKIVDSLPNMMKQYVTVDDRQYTLNSLRRRLEGFDFIIGTRLHMCILGWLSGTPAFNISYEEKGKACYEYLQMDEFSIDYNESNDFSKKLNNFLDMEEKLKNKYFAKIREINKEMDLATKNMLERIQKKEGVE
ncbi:polysaccharide pyruvyl transferase family protein [Enterococcus rivorum]|uniref:Polysaccharide pyruvyl transferase domain-containing protein n=1 Tax=Enterococcus rivorum TaxID=762845 RepID=A0A1E5KSF2_9ENTE|nr:polysaccharide pyruvyl transferase family protein [Enterococcus rivorum]MBP2097440.1 polysaccharide pyruvyl transferase WcaK-like protein [Enterococcus rivorum]OEH80783.1 hypothetical protein BCR26_07215 [Enterococcus rivorum]